MAGVSREASLKTSRTNREMSEATQLRLIEATLQCLIERGYSATSTHEVARRAGVTRGALTHHYSNKDELIAEAAAHLVRLRRDKLREADGQQSKEDLRAQLRARYKINEVHSAAMIEFMVAARTDAGLREAFTAALHRNFKDGWSEARVPAFSSRPDPLITDYVINCFIRGLNLETIVNPPDLVEKIFNEFVDILLLALEASTQKQGTPTPAKED